MSPTALTMAGGSITISGSGFSSLTGATSVAVGGVPCTGLAMASDTSLSCTAPARASGSGVPQPVVVTVAGQASNVDKTVTYCECA